MEKKRSIIKICKILTTRNIRELDSSNLMPRLIVGKLNR